MRTEIVSFVVSGILSIMAIAEGVSMTNWDATGRGLVDEHRCAYLPSSPEYACTCFTELHAWDRCKKGLEDLEAGFPNIVWCEPAGPGEVCVTVTGNDANDCGNVWNCDGAPGEDCHCYQECLNPGACILTNKGSCNRAYGGCQLQP